MTSAEKLFKAEELMKQADDLRAIIEEYINNDDFDKALEYIEKQNKLVSEYTIMYTDGVDELIYERMQIKFENTIYKDYYHLINNLSNKNDYSNLLPKAENGYIYLNPDALEFEVLLNKLSKKKAQEFLSFLSSGRFFRPVSSVTGKSEWVFKEPNIADVKWLNKDIYNLYTPGTRPPFDAEFPHLLSVKYIANAGKWKVTNNIFQRCIPTLNALV